MPYGLLRGLCQTLAGHLSDKLDGCMNRVDVITGEPPKKGCAPPTSSLFEIIAIVLFPR